jgi:hypothetical protein
MNNNPIKSYFVSDIPNARANGSKKEHVKLPHIRIKNDKTKKHFGTGK